MPNENAINRRRKHIAELERAIELHKKTRAGWEHDATLAEALVILARLRLELDEWLDQKAPGASPLTRGTNSSPS